MRILFSFLILFSFSPCQGQELYHRILNSDNGLPSNKVHNVYEDSKGYIWFGTENGVCRWDSKNFVTYTIKDGLPNNEVLVIFEDSKGRIWFSTFSNELCYLQNGTIFNRKNDKRLEKISIIKGGKLCEHKGAIYYFNYPTGLPQKFNVSSLKNENSNIKNIAIGSPEIRFWNNDIVSYGGNNETGKFSSFIIYDSIYCHFQNWRMDFESKNTLKIIDNNSKTFSSVQIDSMLPFLKKQIPNYRFYSNIIKDSSGMYLSKKEIQETHKNYKQNPIVGSENSRVRFSGNFISDLHQFQEFSSDLVFVNKTNLQTKSHKNLNFDYDLNHSKILNNKIFILTQDNTLWLSNLNIQNFKSNTDQQNSIHKLFLLNNKLYLLYNNGVIKDLYTNKTNRVLTDGKLYNLDFGENNQPIATSFRYIVNIKTNTSITNFPFVSSLFKGFSYSPKHKLYTINNSSQGLYIQDLKQKATKISDLTTYTSFIDSRDRLWIGTVNKLYVTNTFLPKVEGEKEVKLNKDFDIFCSEIKEDAKGNIFFTTNDGVYVIDKNDKKYHIDEKNFLSSNECVTLKLDKQNHSFFVATRNGVNHIGYHIHNGQLKFSVINKFFKEDGLTYNEIKDILIDGDSLWVASAKGLDLISDKNYRPDSLKIPVHFNKIIINDSIWKLDTFYHLNHNQNNLKIDYSAIYYQRRERLDIRYRLIKDGDTSEGKIENSVLQLFSLASGSYTLQIYAYDRDYPYIHSEYRTLRFEISPPYYKTWWFYSLILLGALSILGGLMWYRNKNKLEQVKLKGELNKYKLQGLQNQMNPHFVFNSMSTIQDLILTEQNVDALDFISDFSHLMRTMLQNSRNETISLAQEINFLKRYIELEQIRYSHTFDYKFETEIPEDELNDIYIPTMMIQPIVENAIKHGVSNLKERRGLIDIHFSLDSEETYLTVNIIDNGQGKSSSKSKNHTSTAINVIQERLNIYTKNNRKGQYKVEYSDKGTRAELILPI
ncbi:MAG: histidine kinase [Chitinophagales bacterium]|nr:histidine kinase [Sphingobacteriales bacterium]